MAEPRTRTVTFLLTDVEGSTALWEADSETMRQALAHHDALIEAGIVEHGGMVVKTRGEGDSIFAVFDGARDAVGAASALQVALRTVEWPTPVPLRVRIAVDTGEVQVRDQPAMVRWERFTWRLESGAEAVGGAPSRSEAPAGNASSRAAPALAIVDLAAPVSRLPAGRYALRREGGDFVWRLGAPPQQAREASR